jgi:MFS family permease
MAPRVSFAGVHPLHHCKLWYFLAFGAYACVSPYLPLHYRRWGLTPDEVGFINCLRPLVSFAITPAWGFLADHTGRHNAILVAKMLLQGYGTLALFALCPRAFASVFAFVVALEIFSCANNTLADSATQLMCERARSLGETPSLGASYGDQRLWGAVAWGFVFAPAAGAVVAYAPAPVADAAPFYAHAALLTIGAGVSLGLDFEHRGQSAGGGGGGRKSRRRRRVERAREAFEEEADEADVADEADADREGESAALLLSDDDEEEEEDRDGGAGAGLGGEGDEGEAAARKIGASPGGETLLCVEMTPPTRRDLERTSAPAGRVVDDERPDDAVSVSVSVSVSARDGSHSVLGDAKEEPPRRGETPKSSTPKRSRLGRSSVASRTFAAVSTPSRVALFATFAVMSASMAVTDTFLFLWLDDLGGSELLMGVALGFTCLSEVAVFAREAAIKRRLGTTRRCVVLILACYALRQTFYGLALPRLVSPWWVLPVQLLHGVTFGLYWSVGNGFVRAIAPRGCTSAVMGVFGASASLGGFLGASVGGMVYARAGGGGLFAAVGAVNAGLAAAVMRFGPDGATFE